MRRRVDFGPRLIGRRAELRSIAAALSPLEPAPFEPQRADRPSRPAPSVQPGVLIAGPAGVGKSRLAQEAAASWTGSVAGRPARRLIVVRTTGGGTALPLSGLLAAVPGSPVAGDNPARWALAALREIAEAAQTVLFIDDVQQLDAVSAAVVHQLVADRTLSVLATMRTGQEPPDAVTALWKDLGVSRLELAELPADDIDALVAVTLDGPIEGQTLRRLRQAAGGNALFLRELLLSAHDGRLLTNIDGLWRLAGPLPIPPQLTELLDGRLAATDRTQRDALELLAIGEPLALPVALRLIAADALEELERRGLITVREDGGSHAVRLSHPLYGELLRGRVPELGRLRHSRQLADALAQTLGEPGPGSGDDVLRVALWRLEGGGPVDAALMLAAAEHASLIRDHELTARLAASAYAAGGGTVAGMTAARALFQSGQLAQALAWCDRLHAEAADDTERAMLAVQHVSILAHGADDVHAGLAVLDGVRVTHPRCRERLRIARLYLRSYQLDCSVIEEAADAFATGESLDSRLAAAGALGGAYMLAGRFADCARTVREAVPLAARHTGAGRLHADSMQAAASWIRAHQPDPAGALDDAQAGYDASIQPPDRPAQAFAALTLAQIALLLGQPQTAYRWAGEAGVVAEQFQLWPVVRWAAGVRLQAAAQLGDGAMLAVAANELAARPATASSVLLFEMDVARGRAWHAAARGNPQDVADVLVAEVRRYGDRGATGVATLGILDLIRLGQPAAAALLLDRYPSHPGWPLGELVTRYAAAATAGDGRALLRVAHDFAGHRMALHAAEAARSAARCWQHLDRPAAARACLVADVRLAGCAAGRAPSLLPTVEGVLTERETQLIRLAADGQPSRGIAARLHLSERTVENHLHRAYGKLGVSGREEVRHLLDGVALDGVA